MDALIEKLMSLKPILSKLSSVILLVLLGIIAFNVAEIGVEERQTFYYHILFILIWLSTSGIGIFAYSAWGLSKHNALGEDNKANQQERIAIIKAHAAIIIASAILVFGTVFVYFGKAASTVGQGLGN